MKPCPKFITVRNKNMLTRIETKDLYAVVADSYCVTFRTENNQHFTCSKLLKEVQLMLPPPKFVRVSKSCLINMDKVSSFKLDTREIIMENGERYQVSVRKVKEIRMLFSVVG